MSKNRLSPLGQRGLIMLLCEQMLAAKAYDLHNGHLMSSGLSINTPET